MFVDDAAIKRRLTIEEVAAWLGLETKEGNGQLRAECPVHEGGKRSLVITPEKQVFFCFAQTGQKGGDLIELVAHCHQLDTRDAAIELQTAFMEPKPVQPEGLHKVSAYLDHGHEDVKAIGLTPEQAREHGIGYATRGTMRGRVLFPIRNNQGTLTGYAGFNPKLEPPLKLPKNL